MMSETILNICETRMLIGFLGEKSQFAWWNSSFLTAASKAFLAPICPKSTMLAQFAGVCRAAQIVHDEYIGIAKHYHLYRLPDVVERQLLKCVSEGEFSDASFLQHISSKEKAYERLLELGVEMTKKSEGPVIVGDYSPEKTDMLMRISRSHYIRAFHDNYKIFPYMR